MSAILKVNNLTYSINDQIFFKDFNMEVEAKKITSIIAPNKSGKNDVN